MDHPSAWRSAAVLGGALLFALPAGVAMPGALPVLADERVSSPPRIYRWIDEHGIAHYTTDPRRVPADLRAQNAEPDATQQHEAWAERDRPPEEDETDDEGEADDDASTDDEGAAPEGVLNDADGAGEAGVLETEDDLRAAPVDNRPPEADETDEAAPPEGDADRDGEAGALETGNNLRAAPTSVIPAYAEMMKVRA